MRSPAANLNDKVTLVELIILATFRSFFIGRLSTFDMVTELIPSVELIVSDEYVVFNNIRFELFASEYSSPAVL